MKVISIDEAAARTGVVRRTFDRLVASGEGPGVIYISPRRRGILEDELDQWVLKRRHAPPADTYRPQVVPADAME